MLPGCAVARAALLGGMFNRFLFLPPHSCLFPSFRSSPPSPTASHSHSPRCPAAGRRGNSFPSASRPTLPGRAAVASTAFLGDRLIPFSLLFFVEMLLVRPCLAGPKPVNLLIVQLKAGPRSLWTTYVHLRLCFKRGATFDASSNGPEDARYHAQG